MTYFLLFTLRQSIECAVSILKSRDLLDKVLERTTQTIENVTFALSLLFFIEAFNFFCKIKRRIWQIRSLSSVIISGQFVSIPRMLLNEPRAGDYVFYFNEHWTRCRRFSMNFCYFITVLKPPTSVLPLTLLIILSVQVQFSLLKDLWRAQEFYFF